MKKKAVKLATASAIVASAFAATSVSAAENTVDVNKVVKQAEENAGALKWAISAEYTADGVNAPHALYNLTKKSYAAAEKAVAQTKGEEKVVFEERLRFVKQQLDRTQNYIDAITASDKVKAKTAALNKAVADKDLDKVEKLYHSTTAEARKQAEILYRVYGQSTRELILVQSKGAAEAAVKASQVDVTVKIHLDNAADYIQAGELEKASEQVAKANSWLGQTSATFKSELTSYRDDVVASLPLAVTGVSFVNDTTVSVQLSKPAGNTLSADDFHFTDGLEVTAIASVSDDKETVTLTTTKQTDGRSYSLTFKGERTGLSFVNPKEVGPGVVVVDSTKVERKNAQTNRPYKLDLTNINGSKYTGDVIIRLKNVTGNADITSIEGAAFTGSATAGNVVEYPATVGVDGQLSFTLTSTADASDFVEIEVVLVDQNGVKDQKVIELGDTYFYKLAKTNDNIADTNLVIDDEIGFNFYKNAGEDYFVFYNPEDQSGNNSGIGAALKYVYDGNDKFFIDNREVSLSQFENALSSGDDLTVDYKPGNTSTFHLTTDVTADTASTITTPSKVVRYDGVNYRVSGKGQPGFKVQLFKDAKDAGTLGVYDYRIDQLVGEATVASNGTWTANAVNLTQDQVNNLIAVQFNTQFSASYYGDQAGDNSPYVEVVPEIREGAFALTSVKHEDNGDYLFGINDTLEFIFKNNVNDTNNTNDYKHELNVAAGATITLTDARGKEAVLTVAEQKATVEKDDVVIKGIKLDTGFGLGNLNITATTGLTNQDNQVLDLSASELDQEQFKPKHPVPGVLVDGPTPSN